MSAGRNEPSPSLTARSIDRTPPASGMPTPSTAWRTLAFDEVLDAVLFADDERRYVDANEAACALLGLSLRDLLGKRIEDLTVGPSHDVVAQWKAFLARGHDAGEFRLKRADGALLT